MSPKDLLGGGYFKSYPKGQTTGAKRTQRRKTEVIFQVLAAEGISNQID